MLQQRLLNKVEVAKDAVVADPVITVKALLPELTDLILSAAAANFSSFIVC
jgi:hypothetical protein